MKGLMSVPVPFDHSLRIAIVLVCSASITLAQTAVPPRPILANLTFPLDVTNVKVGTRVKARVVQPWSGGSCELRAGVIVEGHVSQLQRRSKTDPRSAIDVVFDSAECTHHSMIPFKATVVALLGPTATSEPIGQSGLGQAPPLTGVAPLALGGGGAAGASVASAPGSGFRSVEAASSVNRLFSQGTTARKLPDHWTSGQVVDVPLTRLAPGLGIAGGSIIWASSHDVRLELATTLILLPTPD